MLKVKSNDKEMILTLQTKHESNITILTRAQTLLTQTFPRTSSVLPISHAVKKSIMDVNSTRIFALFCSTLFYIAAGNLYCRS